MTQLDEIRRLTSVADCEAWRAKQGDLNSMTVAAFLARLAALRKLEGGE